MTVLKVHQKKITDKNLLLLYITNNKTIKEAINMVIREDNTIELRAIEYKDVQLLKEIINDPEIEKMVLGWSFPVSDDQQINWITSVQNDPNTLRLIISVKEFGAIGVVSLSELDYKNGTASANIKTAQRNEIRKKGFGYQAMTLIIDYAFNQLNLNCIDAEVLHYNYPSQNLFKKCGFQYEGTLRKRIYKEGDYQDIYSYSLLRADYEANK